jgi:hypothetical protein
MQNLLKCLSPAALIVGAGLLAGSASAAPVGNLATLQAPTTSNVENVAYGYRRCWRHHGRLHCRRAMRRYGYANTYYAPYPYYGYGYGYDYPSYGYGYGYGGPVFGFSFGGGRNFYGGGHRGFHGGHHGGHRR